MWLKYPHQVTNVAKLVLCVNYKSQQNKVLSIPTKNVIVTYQDQKKKKEKP